MKKYSSFLALLITIGFTCRSFTKETDKAEFVMNYFNYLKNSEKPEDKKKLLRLMSKIIFEYSNRLQED